MQCFLPSVFEDHQSSGSHFLLGRPSSTRGSCKSRCSAAPTRASHSAQLTNTMARARGARPAPGRCHQDIPRSPYEETWRAALRTLKGDESEIPEHFLLRVIPISLSFSPLLCREAGSVVHRLSMSAVAQIPLLWFLSSIPELWTHWFFHIRAGKPVQVPSIPPSMWTDRVQLVCMWSFSSREWLKLAAAADTITAGC